MQPPQDYPLPPLAILTGPTGVGKTEIAIRVAEQLGTEILSADSMAVYVGMDAATAKPGIELRQRVPHHMIDVADPFQGFTVAEYRRRAIPIIDRIRSAGRSPLLVGGTRLYLLSLTTGFDAGPKPSAEFRGSLETTPSEMLHRTLADVDPDSAARLEPQDRKRIVRALEVLHLLGKSMTELQRESHHSEGYPAVWIALVRDRDELYRRVEARVDELLANGLEDEIHRLVAGGLGMDSVAMQGHGYKELLPSLRGEYSYEEGVRLMKRNTRRYVKYQLMWLRGMEHVRCVRADAPLDAVVEEIIRHYTECGVPVPQP